MIPLSFPYFFVLLFGSLSPGSECSGRHHCNGPKVSDRATRIVSSVMLCPNDLVIFSVKTSYNYCVLLRILSYYRTIYFVPYFNIYHNKIEVPFSICVVRFKNPNLALCSFIKKGDHNPILYN